MLGPHRGQKSVHGESGPGFHFRYVRKRFSSQYQIHMYLKYKIVNVFFIFLLIQIGFLKSCFRKKGQCHQSFYPAFLQYAPNELLIKGVKMISHHEKKRVRSIVTQTL